MSKPNPVNLTINNTFNAAIKVHVKNKGSGGSNEADIPVNGNKVFATDDEATVTITIKLGKPSETQPQGGISRQLTKPYIDVGGQE